jgi:hypothetical protein
VRQAGEAVLIQALIPEASVERLDIGILVRPLRLDASLEESAGAAFSRMNGTVWTTSWVTRGLLLTLPWQGLER